MPNPHQVLTLSHDFPRGSEAVPSHSHDWHQLIYASQGVMTITTWEGSWTVPAHRAVWVPGDTAHSVLISGAVSMRTLYLWPGLSKLLSSTCRVMGVSPLLRELILRAAQRGGLDRRVRWEARVIAMIRDELQAIPSPALHLPEPKDLRILRIVKLLHDRPADRRPLEELSRDAGGSKRTIERIFRNETGMSFGKWRQQLRLNHSLRLLAAGEPVTSVAFDSGYDSPSAFVAAFRRTFGRTPGTYFRAPDA